MIAPIYWRVREAGVLYIPARYLVGLGITTLEPVLFLVVQRI
jgi:hypothetical protein